MAKKTKTPAAPEIAENARAKANAILASKPAVVPDANPVKAARQKAEAIIKEPEPEHGTDPTSIGILAGRTPMAERIPFDPTTTNEQRYQHAARIAKEDLERRRGIKAKATWFELINKGFNNLHLRQMILLSNGNLHSTYVGKVKKDAKNCIQPDRIDAMKKQGLIKPEGWRPDPEHSEGAA